jgi:hypothetical protein
MPNDIRLARALAAGRAAAPNVRPSDLLSIVRAVLDASDMYVYDREAACIEHEPIAVRPLCHETVLIAITAGDAVWSEEDACFLHVIATDRQDRRLHLFCDGGEVVPFDLDETRTILVADSVSEAVAWNRARTAEAVGPWTSPLEDLAVEWHDDERGAA